MTANLEREYHDVIAEALRRHGTTYSGVRVAARAILSLAQAKASETRPMFECPECGADLAVESHTCDCTGSWRSHTPSVRQEPVATAWRVWWVGMNRSQTELFEDEEAARRKALEVDGCVTPLFERYSAQTEGERETVAELNTRLFTERSKRVAAEAALASARKALERFAGEVERCEHGHFLIDIAKAIRTMAATLSPTPHKES